MLGFFGGLIHHFWTFVHWHSCETMKCFGAFCKTPRFVSFFLDGTIVRKFICPVNQNRTSFRVFSGSQECQRKKLNVRKSRGHHQTAKEDKGSPGSLWAPQVGLGKIIQVQKTWLWWELPPVKDLATFLKVEKALGSWGHHLWEEITNC